MDPGEQITGTRDEHYGLVSVLYHALHGAETISTYVLDAEASGDERRLAFFREAQATQRQLAERAKDMLGILEVPPGPEGGVVPDTISGGIPPLAADETGVLTGEVPPTTDVPSAPPGDVPEEIPPTAAMGDIPPEGSVSTEGRAK